MQENVSLTSVPQPAHAPMVLTTPELQPVASPLIAVNQPQAW